MKANVIIIRGTHNGQSATVTFTFIGRKIWCAKIECGGKVVDVRSKKNNGLRPCPTHAGYLLDQHFPAPKRKRKAVNLSRERERTPMGDSYRSTARFPKTLTVFNGNGNEDFSA